ncbi:MAG: fused MFS/spermidine synthase, partial [Planctomycetota bacterium]
MRPLVLLLFFLSGACGLVYQVVWTRLLTHVFGTTALAVGTVLAAFMSGLAVGAWLLGRLADRSANPLRLYAKLEIGLGLAALLAHLLLHDISPVYVGVYELFGRSAAALGVARFVLAFVLVMAPTVLMGATLPVLARFVVRHRAAVGAGLSTLYSINTIGAVAGTLATGFFLIGAAGLNGSIVVAVLGNVAIGAIAWVLGGRAAALPVAPEDDTTPAEPPDDTAVSPRAFRWLLVGLCISGLTSFASEIYWTRSLVFLVGNSTYAVTTMLATFLGGIALGGFLARFFVDRVRGRVALFGWVQVLIGVSAAIALPLLFAWAAPEEIRVRLDMATHDAGRLFLSRFGVSVLVMLLPATLIGTTFPLVARLGVTDLRRTGASVGATYAANTVGNVLGALLPGIVLLNWLGIQKGILVMAALNALVGFVALGACMRRGRVLRFTVPAGAAGCLLALALAPLEFRFPAESQTEWHRELYYREGPSATTMVLSDPETSARLMAVDGVEIGGNGITEYKQQLLAHVPKLLLDDVSLELSIGLGSGMLAGESARHARVERIVCVEIEPSVVAGARFFPGLNHGVLDDPRVQVVVDDVATHLHTTQDRYAVVSADEKTAQDYASNGFSYSREYYE